MSENVKLAYDWEIGDVFSQEEVNKKWRIFRDAVESVSIFNGETTIKYRLLFKNGQQLNLFSVKDRLCIGLSLRDVETGEFIATSVSYLVDMYIHYKEAQVNSSPAIVY